VSRSMKLISVARKTSPTIHQRNPRTTLPVAESAGAEVLVSAIGKRIFHPAAYSLTLQRPFA
jgi:hypothetical protein